MGGSSNTHADNSASCLPAARKVRARMNDVRAYASRCLPGPVTCQAAARACWGAQGHAGGFGPAEEAGAEAEVICISPEPLFSPANERLWRLRLFHFRGRALGIGGRGWLRAGSARYYGR